MMTTYLTRIPKYPVNDIQEMLDTLSKLTGELWCAEKIPQLPEKKGFLGFGKQEATYLVALYKTIDRDKIHTRMVGHDDRHDHIGEVQQFSCVTNERELYAYLYGAIAQLDDRRHIQNWFKCMGLEDSLNDPYERAVRFFEEAVELVQVLGMEQHQCKQMLAHVYASNPTDLDRELYGVFFTLHAIGIGHNQSLNACVNKHLSADLAFGRINAYKEEYLTKPKFVPE